MAIRLLAQCVCVLPARILRCVTRHWNKVLVWRLQWAKGMPPSVFGVIQLVSMSWYYVLVSLELLSTTVAMCNEGISFCYTISACWVQFLKRSYLLITEQSHMENNSLFSWKGHVLDSKSIAYSHQLTVILPSTNFIFIDVRPGYLHFAKH